MKKRFIRVKLNFQAPLHLSRGSDSYDRSEELLHSDGLKSAIYASLVKLGSDPGASFLDSFKMSSAFPYFQDLFFYPKPQSLLPFQLEDGQNSPADTFRKVLKNISWVEEGLFEKTLAGQAFSLPVEAIAGPFACADKSQAARLSAVKLYDYQLSERVSVGRKAEDGNHASPFYFQRWHFHPEAGLHFLLSADAPEQQLKAALSLLADEGIGADRSVGCGHFHFDPASDWQEISLSLPDTNSHFLALGLYNPAKQELEAMDLAVSAFQLKRRGGYISSPSDAHLLNYRKRSASFMAESSVLASREAPQGRLLDLRPDGDGASSTIQPELKALLHPIWRDGRPIFLPINPYQNESK